MGGFGKMILSPFLKHVKHRGIGLDLQHQICLESCPADSSSQIFWRGTGSTQMSYPTHPLAGMICMPSTGTEFSSDLESWSFFFWGFYSGMILRNERLPKKTCVQHKLTRENWDLG